MYIWYSKNKTMSVLTTQSFTGWQSWQYNEGQDTMNAEGLQIRAASYFHKLNETWVINETYLWVMAFYYRAEKQTKLHSLLIFQSANKPDLSCPLLTRATIGFSFPFLYEVTDCSFIKVLLVNMFSTLLSQERSIKLLWRLGCVLVSLYVSK